MGRFEKAMFLSLGQVVGLCFGILTPMLLSRWMVVEDFGTYRLLVLSVWLAGFTLHCGMDLGLFYFIKKDKDLSPIYSLNASFVTFVMAVTFGALAIFYRAELGGLLNNSAFADLIPYLAMLIALAVPAQHLEQLLVIHDKSILCITVVASNSILQAAIAVGAIYTTGSLRQVLIGLSILAGVRLVCLVLFNVGQYLRLRRPDFGIRQWFRMFQIQLGYSMPLGVTSSLHSVMEMDRLLVSALYSVTTFAKYSVGCFAIPIIPGLLDNVHNLMSIDMVDAVKQKDRKRALLIWLESVKRIAFVAIPTFCIFAVFAEDIMITLFSEKYADSAYYFQLFLVSFLIFAFDPEMVLRAYNRTQVSMKLQILAMAMTATFVGIGIYYFGPAGALIGKAVANALDLVLKFKIVSGLLDATASQMMPIAMLGKTTVAAVGAVAFGLAINGLPIYFQTIVECSVSGLMFLIFSYLLGIISGNDLLHIRGRLSQVSAKFFKPVTATRAPSLDP